MMNKHTADTRENHLKRKHNRPNRPIYYSVQTMGYTADAVQVALRTKNNQPHLFLSSLSSRPSSIRRRMCLLEVCPRGNHRDDDIPFVSMICILCSLNIH